MLADGKRRGHYGSLTVPLEVRRQTSPAAGKVPRVILGNKDNGGLHPPRRERRQDKLSGGWQRASLLGRFWRGDEEGA